MIVEKRIMELEGRVDELERLLERVVGQVAIALGSADADSDLESAAVAFQAFMWEEFGSHASEEH